MRSRFLLVILLALAAVAAFVGKRVFYPTVSIQAATTTVAPAQSYLVILGVGDTTPTVWAGSVYSASGGRVMSFSYVDPTAQKGKTGYYYVRGLQSDGQIVWVSPMWVTLQ